MFAPVLLPTFSVRIEDRSLSVSATPMLSFLSASLNVSVMLVVLSVSVSLSAGLKVGTGPVVSTVNVALPASPWLPCPS